MANNVPVFEFGKDSYILKHKLNYNTSHDSIWSATTYGILFTDYDIARKTQTTNAENFDPVVISGNCADMTAINLTYYDQSYLVGVFDHDGSDYTEIVLSGITGPTIESGATFVNNKKVGISPPNQEFYVPSPYTILYQVGDYFNIYFHEIIVGETGTTLWEHFGPSGETWVVTGTTENKIPWQVTGTTTQPGFSSGTTTWTVTDNKPILKYKSRVIEIGTESVKFEKRLEDYIYNNLMKIASNTNYSTLCYSLESLQFADKSYYGIKYILEETIWSNYFSISATTNQMTIQPIPNKEDLYFDYDNVQIKVIWSGATEDYHNFITDGLYTKYKLDRFMDQLGYNSGTTVYFDHSAVTNTYYGGGTEFDLELVNIADVTFYRPYTYVYVYGSGGTEHICLILNISGTTFHMLSARVGMVNSEQLVKINNMHTIADISKMLYECYINIENDLGYGTMDFYDGNYFDPNIQGYNVIDPNLLGLWVFDPGVVI